jgi:hypothetical protein
MNPSGQALGRAIIDALPTGARLDTRSQVATFGEEAPLWGIEVRGQPAKVTMDVVATGVTSLLDLADAVRVTARQAARGLNAELSAVDVNVVALDEPQEAEPQNSDASTLTASDADGGSKPGALLRPIEIAAEPIAAIVVRIYPGGEPGSGQAA